MRIKSFIATICLILLSLTNQAFAGIYTYAENSLLANGKWVKIKLVNTGVYKLTYTDIKAMGFTDPSKVRVYGFGGAMMKEQFNSPKADTKTNGDLPEVPVYQGNEYILFWAQGVISWKNTGSIFTHTINPYSSYAYYFLTDSKGAPTTIKSEESISDPEITVNTFNDYALHEADLTNIGATGREFYGEDFSGTTSQTFPFTIAGVSTTIPMTLNVDFISKASVVTPFKVSVNDIQSIYTTMAGPNANSDEHYIRAKDLYATGSHTNSTSQSTFNVKIEYGKSGETNCKLNYIRLNMVRDLKLYDAFTAFRSISAKGKKVAYTVGSANSNVKIWDVTNGKCKQITSTLNGTQLSFAAASPTDTIREFAAVDVNATFPKPEVVGTVTNQNLHAMPQTDMVIISPKNFLTQAEKIAELHKNADNLRVTIVQPEQIYNEFSSGTPDASAYRWLMKMLYDRATSDSDKPKYLLLFGDGTYDNRLLSTAWKTETYTDNFLLTYQSSESLVETSSYVCDDYFGFLDDNEGANIASERLDLGIGRFPVRTLDEASDVVNKVVNYVANKQQGSWKNNLCFVADDGDNNEHMENSYKLTQYLETNYKPFVVNKIYLDSYKKEVTSTGESYPTAKKQLFDLLNSGVMVINYTGHGSVNGWATEQIITKPEIKELYLKRLPLWITATCDFSRYDDFTTTAGEEVLLNKNGGGIALITTTRVVYSGPNYALNSAVNQLLYTKNSDGTRLRLGDILRKTKAQLNGDYNKLNFTLLGDPALKLAYPEYKMEVTSINETPANQTQTLSALSEVTVTGRMLSPDGSFDPEFAGIINPTVFDCEEQITTLNNSGTGAFKYNDRNKVLFAGKDSVRNGIFSFKFTVPKDMSYSAKNGRINLYAVDYKGNEAQGYYENFLLNGTNPNAINDTIGPLISSIYLNNPDFKSGDIVNEEPVLIAELKDESGINVSGTGIGHDMILMVDNLPSKTFILNGYYSTNTGDSKSGKVYYNLPTLGEGTHKLFFRAWDIQNNSSSQTLECVVKSGYAPRIFNLYPNKNPIRLSDGTTSFYLKHDRPNTNITVKMSIFNLSGMEIWSHTETGLSDMLSAYPISWNLKESNGLTVRPGIYIYRASVYTDQTQETTQAKKLIILGQ